MDFSALVQRYLNTLALSGDRLNKKVEELDKDHLLKYDSAISKIPLSVISIFYNEELNIVPSYLEFKRLDRIFNIKEFIFVQNGSTDTTQALLQELSQLDNRVRIVNIEKNLGYGFGFKSALEASCTELVLLNHADCQFDAYAFYTQHYMKLIKLDPELEAVLSVRVGRHLYHQFRSLILRLFVFFILGVYAKDFNGQPKLFLKSHLGNIKTLPNDFGFDVGVVYRLLANTKKISFLNVLELPRFDGKSSWSVNWMGQLNLTKQYIGSILNFRNNRKE